jgi:hypothetical protein
MDRLGKEEKAPKEKNPTVEFFFYGYFAPNFPAHISPCNRFSHFLSADNA